MTWSEVDGRLVASLEPSDLPLGFLLHDYSGLAWRPDSSRPLKRPVTLCALQNVFTWPTIQRRPRVGTDCSGGSKG